jgi:ligand-binding SRPBCC domain-containing protein
MKLYQLHAKQTLPISREKGWEFLSDPNNLKVITPESMGFTVLSGADRKMFSGQIIQYTVAPFPGFNTRWVTEITHVQEGNYFVDEQRFGPYELWHHKHFIKVVNGGVEMEDIIDYKIPFGLIGQIVYKLFIKKQLTKIFKYREEKLKTLFGVVADKPTYLKLKSI